MFKRILVPVDLAEPDLTRPAIETACAMARNAQGRSGSCMCFR